MQYLNLGCGSYYSTKAEWTNVDFISYDKHVIAHNLLQGIPMKDNSFDFVYHSHVLEHFSKNDGEKFLTECHRVLKKNAILRIAVPDLERLAIDYLKSITAAIEQPENELLRANYDWMLLEMYDQTMRNSRAGEMGNYLQQDVLINENFVFERVGVEAIEFRKEYFESIKNKKQVQVPFFLSKIKLRIKDFVYKLLSINQQAYEIGKFRLGGEIHQWMYDRYSLTSLLNKIGFEQVIVRDAFSSYLGNWSTYNIDEKNNVTRKPDSLFIEARKK